MMGVRCGKASRPFEIIVVQIFPGPLGFPSERIVAAVETFSDTGSIDVEWTYEERGQLPGPFD